MSGHNSQLYTIKSDVPQGSILGALLFLIIFNDFFKFTLFADDSTLTGSFKNLSIENITDSINENIETINHWLNVNKFKVNTHKSHHIGFSYRNKILFPPIRLGREVIAPTEKKIGVHFRRKPKI